PLHYEGYQHARWICLDYFSVVVHVFYPEARAFYQLEQLWSDALITEYASL
ncbi:MAG TPA: RsfS/YbeB/iojap family protein, partial [Phaeodactylibacter sp.]|nr:RsfS/YbeB/iojap family protein [Phaeodactylibacter sp.]